MKFGGTIAVWFSKGAASAVAAKFAVLKYGSFCHVRIINSYVKEEDSDGLRFQRDVERWIGQPIEDAYNPKYPNRSAVEVWDERGYMSGIYGAPCTGELKKEARYHWEKDNHADWHILGYTADPRDQKRYYNFVVSERPNVIGILIDHKVSKMDCYRIIQEAGIELPLMYRLGYPNNNCIGCVKVSSPTYWNHVRKVHPKQFQERAAQSRSIGCKLVEVKGGRIYLDELDPSAKGRPMKDVAFECGVFCEEKPV